MTVLAVDPGSHKCGLAVITGDGKCAQHQVIDRKDLCSHVRQWIDRWSVDRLLVGGATGSRPVIDELRNQLKLEVTVVDEFRTSERARQRYFLDHPPRGLWRLVPLGLQVPSVAIDDYAAIVMAEDYLAQQRNVRQEESA